MSRISSNRARENAAIRLFRGDGGAYATHAQHATNATNATSPVPNPFGRLQYLGENILLPHLHIFFVSDALT